MSNRFKAALILGIGMTFIFLFRGFWDIFKAESVTALKITGSFVAAIAGGIASGLTAYFIIGKSTAAKLFGKKENSVNQTKH